MYKISKNGFTLVELSIVLVIIGLLIGGILVGQSIISAAQIQGYVKKFQQYDIAEQTFISKYRQIPGDSNMFVPPGNNNRMLDGAAGCSGQYPYSESGQVWFQMKQAGVISTNFTGMTTTTCGGPAPVSEKYSPLFSTYGGQKYYLNKGTMGAGSAYYAFSGSGGKPTKMYSFMLSTMDYIALDEKMDGSNSARLQASSEYDTGWETSPPRSKPDEVISIIYLPEREMTYSERVLFACDWAGNCYD